MFGHPESGLFADFVKRLVGHLTNLLERILIIDREHDEENILRCVG